MAFPDGPLDVRVDMQLGGSWVDVTSRALTKNPITIIRGRGDESSRAEHSKCAITLRNRDGWMSPRNPSSPYYGQLGRNTPVRVRVGDDPVYLYMPGIIGHYLSTPDHASIDLTGDIDVRVDVTLDTWRGPMVLASKYATSGDQRSWAVTVGLDGLLRVRWSPDGTLPSLREIACGTPVPAGGGRLAVRVALDVSNGAGGATATFYTAPSLGGTWTQLGAPVVSSGTSSIFAGSAPLEIGSASDGTSILAYWLLRGRLHGMELRSGIGGSVVASPDPESQAEGATSWTAGGKVWTVAGTARVLKPARMVGEVGSLPPRWGASGQDVETSVEVAGIGRRLGQGQAPLESPLKREVAATPSGLVAYWPLEDLAGSTSLASALPNGTALPIRQTGAELGSIEDFVGSLALPSWKTGRAQGSVPSYPVTSQLQARMLIRVDPAGMAVPRLLAQFITSGTVRQWDIWFDPAANTISITIYADDGTQLATDNIQADARGVPYRFSLEIRQVGADVTWGMVWLAQSANTANFTFTATLTGRTMGRVTSVMVGDPRGIGETAVGHLSIYTTITSIYDVARSFNAWVNEPAAERIRRLCIEAGEPVQIVGAASDSVPLGPQTISTLMDLLEEAAAADGGLLHETRDEVGIAYRTRTSLYNQTPRLSLVYGQPGLAQPLEPTDDDQGVRNDVTVQREGGSSARSVLESGPLSVLPPKGGGIGRYDDQVTLRVANDGQLPDLASWRRYLGTVDEARYPGVAVKLHKAPLLIPAAMALEPGDRITIADPPPWLPPDDIDVIAQGYTEVLEPLRWRLDVNASPASPYDVATVGDSLRRMDTDGARLASAVTSGATVLPVETTALAAPLWTTDPAELPWDIVAGGEVMTVTAVADGVADTFARTVSSGWGTSTSGAAWTTLGGSASEYSVGGSNGRIDIAAVSSGRRLLLAVPCRDFEILADLSTAALATGGTQSVGLMGRSTSGASAYVVALLTISTAQVVTLSLRRVLGGVETVLATVTTPVVHAASAPIRVRFAAWGSVLRAKAWLASGREPGAWAVYAEDSAVMTAGSLGVVASLAAGNSNTLPFRVSVDNVSAPNPQVMTVTRSVNGVTKAQPAGTDVHAAHPLVLGL